MELWEGRIRRVEKAMNFLLNYLLVLNKRQDKILEEIQEVKEMIQNASTKES